MAKPILIIKVDRLLNGNSACQIIHDKVNRLLQDEYHVIVLPCIEKPEPEFQALNPDSIEQTDIESIRELIKNLMTQ